MAIEGAPTPSGANVAVVLGRLSRPASERLLPTGERVAEFEITIPAQPPTGRAETVNVVWPSPPTAVASLHADDEVIALGRVRRRFFRSGPVTHSRTEVVAESVVATRRQKAVADLLARAGERLAGIR